MPLFYFSISLDEDDPLERSSRSDNDEEAIQEGCDVFMGLVYLLKPAIARCVVYRGGDDTGPPVGTWTYKVPNSVPDWSARHD